MGEMADMIVDQLFYSFEDEDFTDLLDGPTYSPPYGPAGVGCKFCLTGPLWWVETDKGWRLWDGKELHSCKAYHR